MRWSTWIVGFVVVGVVVGCGDGSGNGVDAGPDGSTDTDTDSDTDTDTDSDGGVASDMTDCEGGKLDPLTNLCWQNPPSTDAFTWDDAVTYCDDLSLAGHDDWRLPMVQELISLLRGCVDGTATGDLSTSECGVTDPDCLGETCDDTGCGVCDELFGPDDDPDGCYWDPALAGVCDWYWSSSSCAFGVSVAWNVYFYNGLVISYVKFGTDYARCVRGGP